MATGQLNPDALQNETPANAFSIGEIAKAIILPLASLRLTVGLLVLAVLMTWVATMEQAFDDVFNVKMRHFEGLLVEVPLQTFFPPAWASSMQNVQGSVFLPSGLTILVLMIINLTSAHSLRFKFQATGVRMLGGIVAVAVAAVVTFLVIANGQSEGVQAAPWVPYSQMWTGIQALVLLLSVGALALSFAMNKTKKSERALLLFVGLLGMALAIGSFALGERAFIGDAAMRIMWQLIQATLAAVVSYVACVVLFKRKAGMVLLHIGVMGLMLNEIWVTTVHNEQRLTMAEGDTISHAVDSRHYELAIVDTSSPEVDRIVTVPVSRLMTGEKITHPDLPFDLKCVKFFPNADFRNVADGNLATTGIGTEMMMVELPLISGTGMEKEINYVSAYVQTLDKESGAPLETHLTSLKLKDTAADVIEANGKNYRMLMRFKTEYKPYQMTLNDAKREDYPGSQTPKYYGSEVTIHRLDTGETTEQTIYMNNPLRYGGETFYQSGMPDMMPGQAQVTVLQVVTNLGWMIPYVCCMFTVVGLAGQFGTSLMTFLNKQSQQQPPGVLLETDSDTPRKDSLVAWAPAALMTVIFAAWAGSLLMASGRPATKGEMRLDLLGQVPITFEGRVQPLDSFARNTLRQLRHREKVANGENESTAAIEWLADLAFDFDSAKEYRTFYLTDPNVNNALGLPSPTSTDLKRKKYVYTIGEVFSASQKMIKLIPDQGKKPLAQWSPLEKRLAVLRGNMNKLMGASFLFGPARGEDLLDDIEMLAFTRESPLTPFVVPSDDPEKPWAPMTEKMGPAWIQQAAKQFDASSLTELVDAVVKKEIEQPLKDRFLEESELVGAIVKRLIESPEFKKNIPDSSEILENPERMLEIWKRLPEDNRKTMLENQRRLAELNIAARSARVKEQFLPQLQSINGGSTKLATAIDPAIELFQKLRPAYVSGDAETFNATLEQHLSNVRAEPPKFYSAFRSKLENVYNSFTPFYVASAIYLGGLLFTLFGWVVWRKAMFRTAVSLLLLAVLVHGIGIAMRVGISGRPPVTTLYSSVLFVTWAAVGIALLVELFTRQGIGNALAAITGFTGLIWAHSMTIVDGDTFTVMVAVLDTTFWLATHVVMISMGYSATFMAGLMGVTFLLLATFSPAFGDAKTRRAFTNVTYGIVCFGLFASFFGTVLGGLWGDDSWGRFWGWDPKENGALMIVLWNALILHARWGGLVKDRGVAALAALGNVVVLWSWKGVNALGVGLHAYAATEDTALTIIVYVGLAHVAIAAFGLLPENWRLFGSPGKTAGAA